MRLWILVVHSLAAVCAQECGIKGSPTRTVSRIVNGVNALPGEWPWQAEVVIGAGGLCGGSLVNNKFVITAAHCVVTRCGPTQYCYVNPANVKVRLGLHTRRTVTQAVPQRDVANIEVHPSYNPRSSSHDIATLELSTAVQFTDAIKPVCMPALEGAAEDIQSCFITGWGTTSSGGNTANVLQEASVRLIDSTTCARPGQAQGYTAAGVTIDESMQCAGDPANGVDSCQGDSGGPLVCLNGQKWELRGATSFGIGCGEALFPGVYAKINFQGIRDFLCDKIGAATCGVAGTGGQGGETGTETGGQGAETGTGTGGQGGETGTGTGGQEEETGTGTGGQGEETGTGTGGQGEETGTGTGGEGEGEGGEEEEPVIVEGIRPSRCKKLCKRKRGKRYQRCQELGLCSAEPAGE